MPDDYSAFSLFHPHAFERSSKVDRFAYYTRAETALSVVRNETLWMRKTSCMNDFRELAFGIECLNDQLAFKIGELERALDGIYPGLANEIVVDFHNSSKAMLNETYITCVSEHASSEDELGRLSMWRAYGGTSGVAIVFKKEAASLSNVPYYASPVLYTDHVSFGAEFDKVILGLNQNGKVLKSLGREPLKQYMSFALQSAVASIKHKGFEEEKEWRIIYNPMHASTTKPKPIVRCIGGVPQTTFEISLRGTGNNSLLGLVDRMIIGPTQYPNEIAEALRYEVAQKTNVDFPIVISDIPLRHNV